MATGVPGSPCLEKPPGTKRRTPMTLNKGGPLAPPNNPLLPALKSVFEDLLRPLKAELEFIRATLQSRRKDHYTVEEVAHLTGRSAYTVRRWITEQRIKAIRISG